MFNFKYLTSIITVSCLAALGLSCSPSDNPTLDGTTSNTAKTIKYCDRTLEETQATYQKLFTSSKTETEIATAREAFLNKPFSDGSNGSYRYDLDTTRIYGIHVAPQVGQYDKNNVIPSPPGLTVKFPQEFYGNIPKEIQEAVASCDIDSLDVHLIEQHITNFLKSTSRVQLVTHFWAFPNGNHRGSGTQFNRELLMGIFESDHDIFKEIPTGDLKPFRVHIHDGAYSPNTAGLNITMAMLDLSFWSVVIDREAKRSSIALHWLIQADEVANKSLHWDPTKKWVPIPNGPHLYDALHEKDSHGHRTLGTTIQALENNSHFFKNTPLLQKLKHLTRLR